MLVDDEPDILDFLGYRLSKAGYDVLTASGGLEAIKMAIRQQPDLVVLDIMMPECDGIRVCDRLKNSRRTDETAIMFLTAGSAQFARHAMQVAHADDFVLKPVMPSDFLGRIKSVLQRCGKIPQEEKLVLQLGNAVLNKVTREFIDPMRYVKLREHEFDIIWLLASHPGKIFSTADIRRELRTHLAAEPFPVKKYIVRLREKIGQEYIKTVAGFGYRFEG